MTKPKASGRWPNAPIALVVVQIQFEAAPHAQPHPVAERIQRNEALGLQYRGPMQAVPFLIGQGLPPVAMVPGPEIGVELRNAANDECVRITAESLTYLISAYQDRDHVAQRWSALMDALCGDAKLRVLRLGLRYVDFIIPSDGHAPEDYFLDPVGRAPVCLGVESAIRFCMYDFARPKSGHLRIQYGRGYGPPVLPPDLAGTIPPPPNLTVRNRTDVSAMLDADRWQPMNETMAASEICAEFGQLRTDISTSFQAIMSDLARAEWKGEVRT